MSPLPVIMLLLYENEIQKPNVPMNERWSNETSAVFFKTAEYLVFDYMSNFNRFFSLPWYNLLLFEMGDFALYRLFLKSYITSHVLFVLFIDPNLHILHCHETLFINPSISTYYQLFWFIPRDTMYLWK